MKLPNYKKMHDTIKQYTAINENMKFPGEDGESFTMRESNKQIKKMSTPRMKLEYIEHFQQQKDNSSCNGQVRHLCQNDQRNCRVGTKAEKQQ